MTKAAIFKIGQGQTFGYEEVDYGSLKCKKFIFENFSHDQSEDRGFKLTLSYINLLNGLIKT